MTTSISGYTASPYYEQQHRPSQPQYYQSKSLLEAKFTPSVTRSTNVVESGIGSRHFAQYAEGHSYRKGISPAEPSFVKMREQALLSPARETVSPKAPVSLSPSLQAAAAKSLPPLITLANKIPPIAETRPTTAVAASVPLPSPRELIRHTSIKGTENGVAAPLAFGSTTKIVPLPVTTTRPLPMVDRQKIVARPAVILSAREYSLQPSMTRSSRAKYASQQSRIPGTFSATSPTTSQRAYYDRTANFRFPAQSGPDFISAIGNLNIPPGFTSVNPPGRSRSHAAKKKQESREDSTKQVDSENVWNTIPSVFTTSPLPLNRNEAADGRQEDGPTDAPHPFVDLHKSFVIVKDVDQVKRPRGRPPGSKTKKRKRADSEICDLSGLESGSTGSKSKVPRMDAIETDTDRPAICSLNPDHPLYQERLRKGELTDEVVCDKRFARNSDRVRHERTHCDDRPFACTVLGCGKSFIQRSALTVHERTHTGERPHVCDVCAKRFADSSSLARHRRLHTKDKPYRCSAPRCSESFARKLSLCRHFHSSHSDLPVPSELAFVPKTRKQSDGVALSTGTPQPERMEVDSPGSTLTDISDSDDGWDRPVKREGSSHSGIQDNVGANDKVLPGFASGDGSAEANGKKKSKGFESHSPPFLSFMPPNPGNHLDAPQTKRIESRSTDGRRTKIYDYPPGARDEIAMPFDAIYGLKPAKSLSKASSLNQKVHLPSAYSLSFPVPSHPSGKPLEQPGYYSAIPTPNIKGLKNMMYPMYQNRANIAPKLPYDPEAPVIIETGSRNRLVGYRMRAPSRDRTQTDPTMSAKHHDPAVSRERGRIPNRPDVIELDTDDEVMGKATEKTRHTTTQDVDSRRLQPLEIPAGKLWSLASAAASAAQMSSVRSSLESVQSKDSAITLIGTPSTSFGASAPSNGKGVGAA